MTKRFDLEQEIMSAWGILEDLKTLSESVTDDNTLNILIGLQALYELKFQKLWETFEWVIKEIPRVDSQEYDLTLSDPPAGMVDPSQHPYYDAENLFICGASAATNIAGFPDTLVIGLAEGSDLAATYKRTV